MIYDLETDAMRPVTQADVDRLVAAVQRFAIYRDAVVAATRESSPTLAQEIDAGRRANRMKELAIN